MKNTRASTPGSHRRRGNCVERDAVVVIGIATAPRFGAEFGRRNAGKVDGVVREVCLVGVSRFDRERSETRLLLKVAECEIALEAEHPLERFGAAAERDEAAIIDWYLQRDGPA